MGYATVGNAAIDRATIATAGSTYIDTTVSSPIRGIIKKINVYCAGAGTIQPRVFHDDGTNWVFVSGTASLTVASGLNTFDVWLPIEKGDYIGFYAETNNVLDTGSSGGTDSKKAGDISGSSAKNTWTDATDLFSINGTVFSRVGAIFVS